MDPDRELRRLLRHWEAPRPSGNLDNRVRCGIRMASPPRWSMWLPIAVAVLLMAIGVSFGPSPRASTITIETKVQVEGFTPIAEGKITVTKAPRNQ